MVIAEDPGPPYLFVDLYPFDLGPAPPWTAITEHPQFYGAILKATDGTGYGYTAWFKANFRKLCELAGDRRGVSFFAGGYHYLQFLQSGIEQADYYLRVMRSAGWSDRDIIPIVDVEFGGERAANRRATSLQIIDRVTEFASRIRAMTGRRVMLYGRGLMRDRGITSKMGCDQVWNPAYTQRMVTNGLVTVGGKPGPWALEDIALWQYCGDGVAAFDSLPHEIRGFGKVDISVFVDGASRPTLRRVQERML